MDQTPTEETKTEERPKLFEPRPRTSKWVWVTVVIVILAALGGAGWYVYSQNFFLKSQPVIQEVASDDTQEEETPLVKDPVAYLVADLPFDKKSNKQNNGVYTISFANTSVDPVFTYSTTEKTRANVIGITESSIYFYTNEKGYAFEIKRYDRTSQKTDVVLKSKDAITHFDTMIMSPDKKYIAYTETCGYECTKNPEPFQSDITLLDLSDNSTRLIRHFSEPWPLSVLAAKWETQKYITLGKGCECDGVPDQDKVELLDVANGNVVTVALDSKTQEKAVSLDGTKVLYTTYESPNTDKAPVSHKASLVVKNIATGTITTLLSATKDSYAEPRWVSDNQVMVTVTHAEKYEGGLIGFYPIGKQDVVVFKLDEPNNKTTVLAGAKNPVVFGVAYPYVVFAAESPFGQDAQTTKKLQFINLETGTQGTLIVPSIASASIWE